MNVASKCVAKLFRDVESKTRSLLVAVGSVHAKSELFEKIGFVFRRDAHTCVYDFELKLVSNGCAFYLDASLVSELHGVGDKV